MKRVHSRRVPSFVMSILLPILCCGCSGQGTFTADGGGIGGTGIVNSGPITAFGSVLVNGTEFDTRNALIVVNGEERGVGDTVAVENLDVGRVVTVEGILASADGSQAVADRVLYTDNVEGPVETIRETQAATREIVVLGQTVVVNDLTAFKGTTIDTLMLNDVVAVSGLIDDARAIRASFLQRTGEFTPGLEVGVSGTVENLDTALKTFKINDLAVDYSAADTSALPGGAPTDGLIVEVEGALDVTGGEMLASEVELADTLGNGDGVQVEITGFVTGFISAFDFTVGYQAVQTDTQTLFVDGTPDDVGLGVKLEVEGHLAEGVLLAREVEFWEIDQVEVEGPVTDFVSIFEFTVGNQVVHTDGETVFDGGTPDDIAPDVRLEIKGRLDGDILVADKVSFESA